MGPLSAEIGHRIYGVRRALGPDPRHEMPQRAFAELLNGKAAELFPDKKVRPRYDSSVVTRLEKGERRVTVQDVTVVAAADPEERGELWIGWGRLAAQTPAASEVTGVVTVPASVPVHSYTEEERKADAIQAAKDRAARARRKKRKAAGGR